MKEWYEIKVRGVLGDDPNDMKKITILNRSIEWTGEKWCIQPKINMHRS